jgi:hypothetical protein
MTAHPTLDVAAGAHAALTVVCTSPMGERVVCNARAELRGGNSARWHGVQAWDE